MTLAADLSSLRADLQHAFHVATFQSFMTGLHGKAESASEDAARVQFTALLDRLGDLATSAVDYELTEAARRARESAEIVASLEREDAFYRKHARTEATS